jgi:hypothetical protein
MITQPKSTFCPAIVLVLSALIAACSGGPDESAFVEACLKEGQRGVNLLDQELGVTRDEFCKCGAAVAGSSLSADAYRAMILEMQGDGEEARAITSAMNETEQIAMLEVTGEMLETCAEGAQ